MTFIVDECMGSPQGRGRKTKAGGLDCRIGVGRQQMQRKTQGYSTRNIKYSAQCSYLAKVSKSSIWLYKQRNHM